MYLLTFRIEAAMPAFTYYRASMIATLLIGLSLGVEASATIPEIVGEVTTVIGTASLRQGDTEATPIRRGASVHAGDRIETTVGGHVHIRFIDGGLVSIRPGSRLHVQEYRKDSAAGRGAIRFQLEHGVVRSVTGNWGEHDRERFRLNTPVAAIGIKGTDFVVKSSGDLTQASVISGAIVMSPLEGSCLGTLGPCNQDRSALLSAEMQGKMLELRQTGSSNPRFVPIMDLEARLERPALAQQNSERGNPSTNNTTEKPAQSEKLSLNNSLPGQLVDATLSEQGTRVSNLSETHTSANTADRPLIWMRNALGWNIPPNSISQRFDQAEAASRQAVVGNFFITLFRDENQRTSFTPPASSVAFALANASASFSRQGVPYEPVSVSSGKLNVDFTRATYETSLGLSGSFGETQFTQNGTVSNDGKFIEAGKTQSIAGAFSLDSRQAAYQFEKTVGSGKVSGITLWGR